MATIKNYTVYSFVYVVKPMSRPRSRCSVGSIGTGSDSDSVSSSPEMDVSVGSSEGPDVSSAACASSEGDTSSSIETSTVIPHDPSCGPKAANITVGPFRPKSKDMPGLKYPSRLQGQRYRCFMIVGMLTLIG